MDFSPKEVLIRANEILKRSLDKKNFVTVIYGVLDKTNGTVKISRAGHLPVILVRDKCLEKLKPGGIGLGLDFSGNFENNIEEIEIKLKENDILVMYTDGIPESKNSQMEDFGEERFERVIVENSNGSVDELSNQILKDVTVFSQGNPQHDDITLVIFKWKNKNAGEFNGRV
jgi:serine phosphatase RsbU (regulator of sigma subunit)